MIRGVTFDLQLEQSKDHAHEMHFLLQGKRGITTGCAITTDVNGDLVVSDGRFIIFGRQIVNVGNTIIPVPDVSSGVLYSILVFEIDLSQENTVEEFNQGEFKIISSPTSYPTPTMQDLDDGGTIYQMEFCRFENRVAGITYFEDTRTIIDDIFYNPIKSKSYIHIDSNADVSETSTDAGLMIGSPTGTSMIKVDDNEIVAVNPSTQEYANMNFIGKKIILNTGATGGALTFALTADDTDLVAYRQLNPATNNTYPLGKTSSRWKELWCTAGAFNTSDANEKQQVGEIPSEWLDAWSEVNYVRYKFNDAVAQKGNNARWHIGMIAQEIETAFESKGLDAFEIGIIGYDEWIDETGLKKSMYSVRFDECQFLEMALMRREINRLKQV